MATPSEHLTDIQLQNMVKPITEICETLARLSPEARIRVIAGVACFFGVQLEVVERIERAGKVTSKLVATGAGAPKRG